MTRNHQRIAVIGAGVAGLSAARQLAGAGDRVTVFDKGRGPGGRTSTRRADGLCFDHGAPYTLARGATFSAELGRLRRAGVAATWEPRRVALDGGPLPKLAGQLFVGVPAMNCLARFWAAGLDVRSNLRVVELRRDGERLALEDEHGERHAGFDRVIVTTPVEQAIALTEDVSPTALGIGRRRQTARWVAMVAFDRPVPVDFEVGVDTSGALSLAVHDGAKPGRDAGPTWVLHGSRAWSEANLDLEPDAAARALLSAFGERLDVPLPPLRHLTGHRWRYADATESSGPPIRVDDEAGLVFAGDALGGGGIEGAHRSGLAAAAHLRRVRPIVPGWSAVAREGLHPFTGRQRRSG